MTELPSGFTSYVTNLGIKDSTDDFVVVCCPKPVAAAGVFTQSRFAGPSVTISRAHLATPEAAAMVVISKNANVATGPQGEADAQEVCDLVANRIGVRPDQILLASTGVIGRPYPMDAVRDGIAKMPTQPDGVDVEPVARGIMTTDTVPKIATATIIGSTAKIVGVAKGVGMIEPDMATMIALITTDAELPASELDARFRSVVDRTFNCVSIDTDTSTSDTAMIMASGAAGPVDGSAFEAALNEVCESLVRMIARDGEGAEKLIEVMVDSARDQRQARLIAKAIVNSPLVKTAVHGADPNWGRVAMAIGKNADETDIDQKQVIIRFGSTEVYPHQLAEPDLEKLSSYLQNDEVRIHVSLGTGAASATVWGCDLTDGYIRINADYTT